MRRCRVTPPPPAESVPTAALLASKTLLPLLKSPAYGQPQALERTHTRAIGKEARTVLDSLAAKELDSNGRELIASRRFPKPRAQKGDTQMVNLVALFLVPRPTVFRAVTVPTPEDTTAVVEVLNQEGQRRLVDLRRERGEWRLHHVDYSKLPGLPKITTSKLPHERKMVTKKITAPAKKPEPQQPEPPAIEPDEKTPKPEGSALEF